MHLNQLRGVLQGIFCLKPSFKSGERTHKKITREPLKEEGAF